MKILLLGGTGAMGISLADILSSQGHEITITSRKERLSAKKNVHFIIGNAHDNFFLRRLLDLKFDAVIDFMIYTTDEFKNRYEKILGLTDHYVFLSSARVYAEENGGPITEESARLLDICTDEEYLMTDEYALSKARQENLLMESGKKNYTIIRPYITYNCNRLQLGVLEKEYWLQRAIQGKSIIFQDEISSRKTTLTYGYDVALAISILVGNKRAYGETFHITGDESVRWGRILDIYKKTICLKTGADVKVYMEKSTDDVARCFGNYYQIHYDRLYDRQFDNSKIRAFCGNRLKFTSVYDGLKKALEEFLLHPDFLPANLLWEAHCDGITNEKRTIEINGARDWVKYFVFRDFQPIARMLKSVK